MRKLTSALLAAAACGLLGGCVKEWQQEILAARMNKMEAALAQGKAVVLMDAGFKGGCNDVYVELTRARDAGPAPDATRRNETLEISSISGPQPTVIQPGDWVVTATTCKVLRGSRRLLGPHAAFRVQPGEVVNVGKLHMSADYDTWFVQTVGTATKRVEPISAKVIDRYRQLFPATMAKMVERPMTIPGPAETRFKRQGTLF